MQKQQWFLVMTLLFACPISAQDLSLLPGHIDEPAGTLNFIEMPLGDGPDARKFRLSVPENRSAKKSRNIRLYFYRLKARKDSGHAPIFILPGGPGSFYNDAMLAQLKQKPKNGPFVEAWLFAEDRDVVLVNQRGSEADKTYTGMVYLSFGMPLDKPYDFVQVGKGRQENLKLALNQWAKQGVDLAGYDILNMIEDIEDIRTKLGYTKIALRGTSFGSQWAMAYMQKYSQNVDRAVLGGVEPLDHGWDSAQGNWNMIKRVESLVERSTNRSDLGFPDVPLTHAIQTIIKRLEAAPIRITSGSKKTVVIGPTDFQRALLGDHGAPREFRMSIARIPKFVYEVYNEDYANLAIKASGKNQMRGGTIQQILIDNSLGISPSREAKLNAEPARRWIGEINSSYQATRSVTPTPVIPDSFRTLKTDLPMLMVHGDLDISTPIENAEEQLALSSNAHLIRVAGGTHGAFFQLRDHEPDFLPEVMRFLDADLGSQTVAELNMPNEFQLPALEFAPMSGATD